MGGAATGLAFAFGICVSRFGRLAVSSPASVSIIVPTFNRAHYLGECLDSLLCQTVAPHQVIVVDDGSTDNTQEVVAAYGSRVHYLHKPNGGKPSAVNLALSHSSGELIWLFDDDDVALPDAIEQRLAVLAGSPEAGFVYSSHHLGSEDDRRRIVRGRLYVPPAPPPGDFFLEIMRGCFFHLNSCLVRRELYLSLGGLDPDLLSSEDYDFQIRLSRLAAPAYCAAPTFVFRQHGGVRGAAQIRYDAADRSKVFRRYSQSVGKKIRAAVDLGEYLAPRVAATLTTNQRRQALLHRMHVMANHGCIEEFVGDLVSLLRLAENDGGLSASDLQSVACAYRRGWAYDVSDQDWPAFVNMLQSLKPMAGGKACIRALSRSVLRLATGNPGKTSTRLTMAGRAAQLAVVAMV